jgi:hypothetical protein
MKITINTKKTPQLTQKKQQLLSAPVYPEAISSNIIARNSDDYAIRAFMIFECLMPPELIGKTFLDVDNDKYINEEAIKRGMRLESPYDIILLYDVLDHEIDNHPVEKLKKAKELMTDNGLMIIRCHPWCSRHATHLYAKNNKAYLHLILTDQELKSIGLYNKPTRRDTLPPSKTYRSWFDAAGLTVIYEEVVRQPLEPIFTQNQVLEQLNISDKSLLEIQFVDYILSKS